MALIDQFNPKRIRSGTSKSSEQPQENKLKEEARVSSVQEIKRPVEESKILLDQYAYKPDKKEEEKEKAVEEKEANGSKIAMAIKEPTKESAQKKSYELQNTKFFGLYDMSFFCEERLRISIWGPISLQASRIHTIEKECINNKLNVYSDSTKEIRLNMFKDTLHLIEDIPLIPEEFINLTGFLRKYFDITEVLVLFNTGEIVQQESLYCAFWTEERLNKYFEEDFRALSIPKFLFEDNCLHCNFDCSIRPQ